MSERPRLAAAPLQQCAAFALTVALASLSGCSRSLPLSTTLDAGPTPTGVDALVLSSRAHDFGRVAQGDVLRYALSVTNAADQPARLESETSGERCQGRLARSWLAAGETTSLDVACATERHGGPLREVVMVRATGTLGVTSAAFRVAAEVTPALAFDLDLLSVEVPFGHTRTSDIRVLGGRVGEARLRLLRVDHPFFDVRWQPGDGQAPPQLRVRVRGATVGYHAGAIVLASGISGVEPLTLPYALRVLGTLTVSPTNPYIDLSQPGRKLCTMQIASAQPGFVVHEVRVTEGPFLASIVRGVDAPTRVQITARQEALADDTRGASGRLLIRSSDRSEPRKEVPVFAFGILNRREADEERRAPIDDQR